MQNKSDLEGILLEKRIQAQVVVPIIQIGNTQCHVNGDEYVRVAYHGFQHLFVLTLADRVLGKKKEFQSEVFPKIEIIGI